MKLDQETIKFIQGTVKTAQLVNIDSIIIEPDHVRAIDDDKTVVIYQNKDVPSLPFGSIGLSRLGDFYSRLDIARTQDDFHIDAVLSEDEAWARSLIMKGKGIKIDYRCAKPDTIQAPRTLHDTMKTRVKLNGNAVLLLQKGQAAMSAETVTIISNDGVSFEIIDVNNDIFKHTFADGAEPLTEDDDVRFAFRYPIKTLLALFKKNPDGFFSVGERGILMITINGLDVYVLPKV